MPNSKVSPALADRLAHAAADEWLEVVVEVRSIPPPEQTSSSRTRGQGILASRETFAEESRPVQRAVQALGGQVTDTIWLNQSLAVRLPAGQVPQLQAVESVLLLDLPHPLTREG
jgi:hypothetical protein